MATKNHNLSTFDTPLPSAEEMRFGIVVAEWNREVTEALLEEIGRASCRERV